VDADEQRWLTPAEDRAWRRYRRMRGLLELRLARDLAAESGLSWPDYDVLSTLSETEGHRLRLTELAGWLLWSKSRLSHHISRMERRGLVKREECAADGRAAMVVLTERGVDAIVAAAPGHVAAVRRHFVDLLTEEEIDALAAIAGKVVGHLTADDDDRPA
jgi:DNA-binding MarR family transcriptional regulator